MVTSQALARNSKEDQLRSRLTELLHRLEQIESIVTVSATALIHQNCERDADVARILQRDVVDRLSMETEWITELLRGLNSPHKSEVKVKRARK